MMAKRKTCVNTAQRTESSTRRARRSRTAVEVREGQREHQAVLAERTHAREHHRGGRAVEIVPAHGEGVHGAGVLALQNHEHAERAEGEGAEAAVGEADEDAAGVGGERGYVVGACEDAELLAGRGLHRAHRLVV